MLIDERQRLDELARRSRRDAPLPAEGHEGALGQHAGDYGTEVETQMEDRGLAEEAERRRGAVDSALERLDDGSWGTCVVCGRAIDDERLEALPETDRCIEHADRS